MTLSGWPVIRRSGSTLLPALALALLTACPAPTDGPAGGGSASTGVTDDRADEGAVIAAHREFLRAIQEGDVEAAVARLDPTDELLIFHPRLENRFDGREEARAGLTRMLGRLSGLEWTEVHPLVSVHGDTAWITSQILLKADGLDQPFVGRGTEIWIRRGEDWRLVHAHWSQHARLAGEES